MSQQLQTAPDTVRNRIVHQFMRSLKSMEPDEGDIVRWNAVVRGSLESLSEEKVGDTVAGVIDTNEQYQYLANSLTECTLRVQIEYWYRVPAGKDPSDEMERLRGNLVQRLTAVDQMLEDGTNARLTQQIRLTSSDRDVEGPREQYGGAYIELSIVYRHRTSDPHRLVSE